MRALQAGFCCILAIVIATQARAEDEVDVGHTAAGQIKAQPGFTPPLVLPVSVFPGISGYATGLVGFHSIVADEPENDLFLLSPASNFQFILVAKDPGIEVWKDNGSAFMQPGDAFFIGPAPFDTHPIFNITTGTPGSEYALTLKLHDTTAAYQDSDSFTLNFTPIPEPGTAAACAGALLGMLRPRRRSQ
jgi:hypothetical protein